jgi:hypothetical protein
MDGNGWYWDDDIDSDDIWIIPENSLSTSKISKFMAINSGCSLARFDYRGVFGHLKTDLKMCQKASQVSPAASRYTLCTPKNLVFRSETLRIDGGRRELKIPSSWMEISLQFFGGTLGR